LKDIVDWNESLFMPTSLFFDAFNQIYQISVMEIRLEPDQIPVTRVDYSLGGRVFSAHAYGASAAAPESRRAILVIPGTGHNQSWAIFSKDATNYHAGIMD